jgi:hypothetical protein
MQKTTTILSSRSVAVVQGLFLTLVLVDLDQIAFSKITNSLQPQLPLFISSSSKQYPPPWFKVKKSK